VIRWNEKKTQRLYLLPNAFFVMFRIILISISVLTGTLVPAHAERGRDVIGEVTVTLIHASDEKVQSLAKFKQLDEATHNRLLKEPRLKFENYRILGVDTKPLFRSFENWAKPVHCTDDLLVRFETEARPSKDLTRLNVELWLSRKKILKTGVALTAHTPMYVLGPEWRQGRMIIVISLTPYDKPMIDPSP
jgi:hypothetical protein